MSGEVSEQSGGGANQGIRASRRAAADPAVWDLFWWHSCLIDIQDRLVLTGDTGRSDGCRIKAWSRGSV